MIGVLTADIIKSRTTTPKQWLPLLKEALSFLESDDQLWDIYRGDSFQIEISAIEKAFISAVYLKACIKTIKNLDVRIAIGLGEKTFEADSVNESNGEAFQFSGDTLESLKKDKVNLKLKTNNKTFDQEFNLLFKLALIAMDQWTSNSAEIVKLAIERPDDSQEMIGQTLNINQTAVSHRQRRAHLEAILELDKHYRQRIQALN